MKKTKISRLTVFAAAAVLLLFSALGAFLALRPKAAPEAAFDGIRLSLLSQCRDELARGILTDAVSSSMDISLAGEAKTHFRTAEIPVAVRSLDVSALIFGIENDIQTECEKAVLAARRPSEVYNDDGSFKAEVIDTAYEAALLSRLENRDRYLRTASLSMKLRYSSNEWTLKNAQEIMSALRPDTNSANPGRDGCETKLQPIDFHYTLPDRTGPAPMPDASCFGMTYDPSEISALLQTDTAQKLIGGQTLDWREDKAFLPGTPIRYYLDETILCIVWQECEHGAVGTFSEVFIADASQLRRKIADDSFACGAYYYPTELSKQANAVLALSGDFYDLPGRVYGVYAYDGKLMNSCLTDGQTCYFTDSGDMIFSYENQFASNDEAQRFLDENNVMFSLSFGPVILDNGVDVTPYSYPLGEVLDTYARCCFGQLGKLHYLAMTINVLSPDYYVYVTLRQAADSMIAHGCKQAYTLDGGQTGSIILGNELINPVQFGVEREMSDIFYFATAIPEPD